MPEFINSDSEQVDETNTSTKEETRDHESISDIDERQTKVEIPDTKKQAHYDKEASKASFDQVEAHRGVSFKDIGRCPVMASMKLSLGEELAESHAKNILDKHGKNNQPSAFSQFLDTLDAPKKQPEVQKKESGILVDTTDDASHVDEAVETIAQYTTTRESTYPENISSQTFIEKNAPNEVVQFQQVGLTNKPENQSVKSEKETEQSAQQDLDHFRETKKVIDDPEQQNPIGTTLKDRGPAFSVGRVTQERQTEDTSYSLGQEIKVDTLGANQITELEDNSSFTEIFDYEDTNYLTNILVTDKVNVEAVKISEEELIEFSIEISDLFTVEFEAEKETSSAFYSDSITTEQTIQHIPEQLPVLIEPHIIKEKIGSLSLEANTQLVVISERIKSYISLQKGAPEQEISPEFINDVLTLLEMIGTKEPKKLLREFAINHNIYEFFEVIETEVNDFTKLFDYQQHLLKVLNSTQVLTDRKQSIASMLVRLLLRSEPVAA